LTSEEAARYDALQLTPIALDSILVVVNLENPLTNLSSDQVRSIFSGEITNWAEVGGADLEIDLLIQKDSMVDVFKTNLMGSVNLAEDLAQVLPSNAAMRASIAADPGAIGLLPKHFQDGSLKSVSINQIQATSEMISSGQYPLVRPYYLVLRGVPDEKTRKWLDFIFSVQGQQIILLEGLEPVQDDR
jgi:phosphate transport system substrate-binding protein